MEKFPVKFEDKPQESQLAKEVWQALGCKDYLTRQFIRAAFKAIRVFDWKQQRYGTKNIASKGARGVATRLTDKIARVENIYDLGRQDEPGDEGVEDTFGDIGVYGIIALLCRWGMWPGSPEQRRARPEGGPTLERP